MRPAPGRPFNAVACRLVETYPSWATHPSCLDVSVERFHEVQKLSLYSTGVAGPRLSDPHGRRRRRRSDCRRPEPAGRPEHASVGAEAAGRHRRHPRADGSLARRRRCPPRRPDAARRPAALRTGPETFTAVDPRRPSHRPHRDPQPRHAWRKPGLCRSGGRVAGLCRRAGSNAGPGQQRRRARGESRGFLQGIVRDRSAAG